MRFIFKTRQMIRGCKMENGWTTILITNQQVLREVRVYIPLFPAQDRQPIWGALPFAVIVWAAGIYFSTMP